MPDQQPSPVGRDPGLQPERTRLAWQRSALSFAAVTIVVSRLTFSTVGPFAVVVLVVGLANCLVIFVGARRRYHVLMGIDPGRIVRAAGPWPLGVHTAMLAGQVMLLAALEIAAIVAA